VEARQPITYWNTGHTEGSVIQDIFEADRRASGGYKNTTGYINKVEYISIEWTERGVGKGTECEISDMTAGFSE
jgi:hypothetical protein